MGPAFFNYKVFILLYHLKFYSGKIYRCKISNPNYVIAIFYRTDAMHCVSTLPATGWAIPNPTIPCGRLPKIPDSDRASISQYRRGTPPKT